MSNQELRNNLVKMLKELRSAGYENSILRRPTYFAAYKCSNGMDTLAWNIYKHEVIVKELKRFLEEVPDDLIINLEEDDYGGTNISFVSEVQQSDEYWYSIVSSLYTHLFNTRYENIKESQLEVIRNKVLAKEELTEEELAILFSK